MAQQPGDEPLGLMHTQLSQEPTTPQPSVDVDDTQFAPDQALTSDHSRVRSQEFVEANTPGPSSQQLSHSATVAAPDTRRLAPPSVAQADIATKPPEDLSQTATVAATDSLPTAAELRGEFAEGSRLDRFVVLRELGRGAMGIVLAGYDPKLDRQVAIKLVHVANTSDPSFGRSLLLREAQALAKLAHPNVVGVHEVGVYQQAIYVAMEYVQGVDLQQWLAETSRSWQEVVEVFVQAGNGLLAAHRRGLVHRDFKPANVLVGDDHRVRVADFGLAAQRGTKTAANAAIDTESFLDGTIASAGALVGTPAYMAPELLDEGSATAVSDQWAFCVALYEALHHERPFRGRSIPSLFNAIRTHEVPSTGPNPEVPQWLHAMVCRGLAKNPEHRYRSLEDLIAALQTNPDAERQRRNRVGALVVLAVATTILLVLAFKAGYESYRAYQAEQDANRRLAALTRQLDSLADDPDEARRVFEMFAAIPENRTSGVLSRAFLAHAERLDDPSEAKNAYASAYIHAKREQDALSALHGLVLRLSQNGALAEAEAALTTLLARDPERASDPVLAGVATAAALARRDLQTALASTQHHPELAGERRILQHLARVTVVPHAHTGGPQQNRGHWKIAVGEYDGDPRPEILVRTGSDRPLMVLDASPELTVEHSYPYRGWIGKIVPIPPDIADGKPALLFSDKRLQLYRPDESGKLNEEQSWPGCAAFTTTVTDLNGDGQREMYVGMGCDQRHLYRLEHSDSKWSLKVAHPGTEATRSGVRSFVAADLNHDDRLEFAVAADAWFAYDIRVLAATPDAKLELLNRKTFGVVEQLSLLRTPGGNLLAFDKRDTLHSPERFPEDKPFGEPAGIYVVDWANGDFNVLAHTKVATQDLQNRLRTADLDGDGFDEILMQAKADILIYRWHQQALQPPLVLHGTHLYAIVDIDDDGRDDLLVTEDDRPTNLYILGHGQQAFPPLPKPEPAPPKKLPPRLDATLHSQWAQAEDLVGIGLERRSAEELATLGRLDQTAGFELFSRAGELMVTVGEHAKAAAYFEAASELDSDRAATALYAAATNYRALGEFKTAGERARQALESPGIDPEVQARAETALQELNRLQQPRPSITLDFSEPLDPRLEVLDPLAVTRDHADGRTKFSIAGHPLGHLPLTWDGGPVVVDFDLEFNDLDWGSEFHLVLADRNGNSWRSFLFTSRGSSSAPEQLVKVVHGGTPSVSITHTLTPQTRVRVRVEMFPSEDLERHTADIGPTHYHELVRPSQTTMIAPGPVELRFVSKSLDTSLHGSVHIRRLHLEGFELEPPETDDDRERRALARLVSNGNYRDVLARVPPDVAADDPRFLWRLDALLGLAQFDEAKRAIAAIVAQKTARPEVYNQLFRYLRRLPRTRFIAASEPLGWDLVNLVGGHLALRLEPAYTEAAAHDLSPLLAQPGVTKKPSIEVIWALLLRGYAELQRGRPDVAKQDFETGHTLLAQLAQSPEKTVLVKRIRQARLEVAVAQGDRAGAHELAVELLKHHPAADIRLEMLHNDRGLRELLQEADWATLDKLVTTGPN